MKCLTHRLILLVSPLCILLSFCTSFALFSWRWRCCVSGYRATGTQPWSTWIHWGLASTSATSPLWPATTRHSEGTKWCLQPARHSCGTSSFSTRPPSFKWADVNRHSVIVSVRWVKTSSSFMIAFLPRSRCCTAPRWCAICSSHVTLASCSLAQRRLWTTSRLPATYRWSTSCSAAGEHWRSLCS